MNRRHIPEATLYFDVETERDDTTLHRAAAKGRLLEILRLRNLSARVRSTTKDGLTPLHKSAGGGHTHVTTTLLRKGACVNAQDNKKQTPLHWSVIGNSKDVVKDLIKSGACVNAADINRETPLHMSAWQGLADITKYLVKYGAELDFRNREGHTPLHLAAWQGHLKVAKILLANGASARIKDNYQCTPENLARFCGHAALGGVIRRWKISKSCDDLDTVQKRSVLGQTREEAGSCELHQWCHSFMTNRMGNTRRGATIHTKRSKRMPLRKATLRPSFSTSSLFSPEYQSSEPVFPGLKRCRSGSITSMQDRPNSLDPAKAIRSDISQSTRYSELNASQPNKSTESSTNRHTTPTASQLQAFSTFQAPKGTTPTTSLQQSSTSTKKTPKSETALQTTEAGKQSETGKTLPRRVETNKIQFHTDEKGKTLQNTSGMYNTLSSGTSETEEMSFTRSASGKSSSITSEKNKTFPGTSEKYEASSGMLKRDKPSSPSSNTSEKNKTPSGSPRGKTSSKASDKNKKSSTTLGVSKTPIIPAAIIDKTSCNMSKMNKMSTTPGTSAQAFAISEQDSMSCSRSKRGKSHFPTSKKDNASSVKQEKNENSDHLSGINNVSPNTSSTDEISFGETQMSKTSSSMTQQEKMLSMTGPLDSTFVSIVQQDRASLSTSRKNKVFNAPKSTEKLAKTSQNSRSTSTRYPIRTSSIRPKKSNNSNTTDDKEYRSRKVKDRVHQFEQLRPANVQTKTRSDDSVNLKRNECVEPFSVNNDNTSVEYASFSTHAPSTGLKRESLQTVKTNIAQKSGVGISHAPIFETAQPTCHDTSSSSKSDKQGIEPGEIKLNKDALSSCTQCGTSSTVQASAPNTCTVKSKASKPTSVRNGQSLASGKQIQSSAVEKNSTLASKISPLRSSEEINGIQGNVKDRICYFQSTLGNTQTKSSSQVNTLPNTSSPLKANGSTLQTSSIAGPHVGEALAPVEEIDTPLGQHDQGCPNITLQVIQVQVSPTFNFNPVHVTTFNVEYADNVLLNSTMEIVRHTEDVSDNGNV